MGELVKPCCSNPLLLLNKAALKLIADGGICVNFPRPTGSPYSVGYARLLWHLFYDGFELEVLYKGIYVPLFHYVPCGQCELCRQSYRNDIVKRAELASCEYGCPPYQFKLTYDQEHLPKYGELQYRDVQLFFKRYRKRLAKLNLPNDFKYIVSGEYGSLGRPHYHVVLFNNAFRCSEFEPHQEELLKRITWECWRKDTWYVFSLPKNFKQCYGSMATYVTKYIGKKNEHEDRFISEAGRKVHRCFVRCSQNLGKSVYNEVIDDYRNGFRRDLEYYNPVKGQVTSHHMTRTELRNLHPTPLDYLPSSVKDAYYSLRHSLEVAVGAGLMSLHDALTLVQNVKINAQHMPLLCPEKPYVLEISDYGDYLKAEPVSDLPKLTNIFELISLDCKILSDYGCLPDEIIEHYLKFQYDAPVSDGSEVGAKLYKNRKDNAVIFDKTED